MEAGGSAVDVRLKTLERDADGHHRTIGKLRSKTSEHDTDLKVQGAQLQDLEGDVEKFEKALKDGLAAIEKKVTDELRWVRRGLWAATFTFTGLILTGFGYILQAILGTGA